MIGLILIDPFYDSALVTVLNLLLFQKETTGLLATTSTSPSPAGESFPFSAIAAVVSVIAAHSSFILHHLSHY